MHILDTRMMSFSRFSTRKCFQIFSRYSSSSTLRNAKHIGPGGFALLSVPIATFCLGTWQVKRHTWKLNLIEEVTSKSALPAIELPNDLEKLNEMEYQKVKVKGTFDHSKELYIGPRQLFVADDDDHRGIMSSQPKSGNLVITPFHVTDRNITILVNRGWVPKNKTNPASRSEAQITDEIELIGKVRLPETRPQFSLKSQPGSHFFYYRDVPRMAAMTGSEMVFLDAERESTIPGGPIGGQTRMTFRNDHLSYLITWYSLSAATSYMWFQKYIHRMKIAL